MQIYFPTTSISRSEADFLIRFQISSVKIVLELLKIDVRELIKAESIAETITPRKPKNIQVADFMKPNFFCNKSVFSVCMITSLTACWHKS